MSESAAEPKKKLNRARFRQEHFAREWVIDHNGVRAAIAAGYSEKAAKETASRLLTRANVRKFVATLEAKRATRLEITADRIAEELAKLAFSNMADYVEVDENGQAQGINLAKLTREQFAAISEIREDATGGQNDGERRRVIRTTIKIADKRGALELLGKWKKMFSDKFELSGPNGGAVPLGITLNFVEPTREPVTADTESDS